MTTHVIFGRAPMPQPARRRTGACIRDRLSGRLFFLLTVLPLFLLVAMLVARPAHPADPGG